MTTSELKEKWRQTPHCPGVYLMRGVGGSIIYVGKAKDLHKRLANYFSPSRATLENGKTRALIAAIEDFDYYEVRNEQESLLLEQKLIKEYRPRYNVQLRDDKRYLLLRADRGEDLPRFSLVRLRKDDGARYIGPFVHSGALKETVEWLNHHFRLRSCPTRCPDENTYKHCHDDVIRHCSAPCIRRISPQEYRAQFDAALELLEGKGVREHLRELTEQMQTAAEELDFELAAKLRDIRENIEKTLEPARRFARIGNGDLPGTVDPAADLDELARALRMRKPQIMECFDISNLSGNFIVASMVRFSDGKPDHSAYRRYRIRTVESQNDFASMLEVVKRRYSRIIGENCSLFEKEPGMNTYAWLLELRQRAKRDEEVWFPDREEPLVLPRDSGALRLLQRLRDEAHRFAHNYNELLMRKRVRESRLDACPGMTARRKQLLLARFHSIDKLRRLTPEQLAEVPGISRPWALQFCTWLAQNDH